MRISDWSSDVCSSDLGQEVAGPDATAELNQMRERYRLAVDGLPPRTKEVYLLHRVEELGYRQIAEQLSISIRTVRSEEHTSELQSLMRISYAVFCLKKKKKQSNI